jgi:DNA-binding NarL/FixJ family response regulator
VSPSQGAPTVTRVLIVDDQPTFRRHLRRLLTMAGLTVIGEAGDIPEAEALAEALQPDMALVDVVLPGVSGIAGTSRLRAIAPRMRVILMSAHRDRAHVFRNAAQEVNAEAFVAKDDLDLGVARAWREGKPASEHGEPSLGCSREEHGNGEST